MYFSFCPFSPFLQGDPALLYKLNTIYTSSEIEFLDINLTKDSSLLLHAIHSPFYLANFKENPTLLWFNNPYKKIREIENLSLLMNSIL